jgi:hypothetical protein
VLVTKGSEAYNPLWIPILSLEITYNIAMFAALILLNVLFFSKHCWFPRLYITIIVVTLVFLPLDAWLVSLVLEDTAVSDPETSGEIIRTFVTGMIWIPYMLKSQRVKATFTRGKTVEPTPVHEMLNNDPEL